MKNIIIIGAGHLGQDIYYLIKRINQVKPTYNILGFLSDVEVDLAAMGIKEHILGPIQAWEPKGDEVYAMGIGATSAKQKIVGLFKSRGAKFATLISPSSYVCETAQVGEGVIIDQNSFIAGGVKIGDFCVIGDTTMARGSEIGAYSNTASYANITQEVKVGMRTQIWSHCVILKSVGNDAVVGAGSVVLSRVRDGMHVFGNPAMPM